MALHASDWLGEKPELVDTARWLIRTLAEDLTHLSGSVTDDEAIIVAVRMRNALESTKAGLAGDIERLADERLEAAPEPPGVDWACETPGRAADVVKACRLIYQRRTGEKWWQWDGALHLLSHVRVTHV